MVTRKTIIGAVLCLMLSAFPGVLPDSWADDAERLWVSRVISVQGHVLVRRQGESGWRAARLDDPLFAGDQIRVETNSRAGIVLSNDAVLRLDQNTTLMFTEIERPSTFIFRLLKGAANFFSHRPRSLKIVTPFVNGVVEGTEFYVFVDDEQSRIDLFEGRILARNAYGELQLGKGQGAVARAGQAPQARILVKPRDSVRWALYYPPVLTLGPGRWPTGFSESLVLYSRGQPAEALDRMNATSQKERDARFYTLRAGFLLNVGRVDQAREDIRQALTMDAANGDALALQAVIAVVQNRKVEALAAARKAVQNNPRSAAAHIALSYAHQAVFSLPEALQDARTAVSHARDNGTTWARLAELQLSTGELDQGKESAQKAAALNPRVAHAHTILGFSYLTRIKIQKAREAFSQAIVLDSAAPLPRLGMGLAKIRDGDLEEGRAQIEIAAGLDPGNALIRSYLGKAYFDEKRGPQDERQFEIAKNLDPNDPTPWFYDAIRKQTLNRPVEALQDLQKSIELNDNRAVYRSRLLLDQDLAARSAALGRIFNDLDFQHLALVEGYKSLDIDSTDYSAHRLLADTYAAKPRHEIARVSELLQSQLFQPLNLTPIQAHLAESETDLITASGPAGLSFNEYNPLYMRNRFSLQASGLRGENSTWGSEFTGSGVFNRISGSISRYHYETDGFRQNNDVSKDIASIFLQGSPLHKTSLQAEYRSSEVDSGDLSQNFNDEFSETFRENKKVKKMRIGGHQVFTSKLEMIVSYVHTKVEIDQKTTTVGTPSIDQTVFRERNGDLIEARCDYKASQLSITAGFGYLDDDLEESSAVLVGPPLSLTINNPDKKEGIQKRNAYVYSHFKPTARIGLTAGLSIDSLDRGRQLDRKQLNPKLGVIWQLSEKTSIRLAGARVLSSTLVSTQTIEPTQISGFNQFYEEQNGTDAKQYGAAIEHKFRPSIFAGFEVMKRDLDVPLYGATGSDGPISCFKWKEYSGVTYFYWAPQPYMALKSELQYDKFDRRENSMTSGIEDIDTYRVPISLTILNDMGFIFKCLATYILQDGEFSSVSTGDVFSDGDSFWLVDAELGFRMPRRFGVLTFGVRNLFDKDFHYQDIDRANPVVTPERFIYANVTISL